MKEATQIVFRRLTNADFYNIYKPRGSERRGGGQTYIDFPTSAVRPKDWKKFFAAQRTLKSKSGPYWRFKLDSIGVGKSQVAEIGQRRPQSFNIRKQTLGRRHSNRVLAWDPRYTRFPQPEDPTNRLSCPPNLVVYLIRTSEGEFWAGWFQAAKPKAGWRVDARLMRMFVEEDGCADLKPGIGFDPMEAEWPFRSVPVAAVPVKAAVRDKAAGQAASATAAVKKLTEKPSRRHKQKPEDELLADMFEEDLSVGADKETIQVLINVRKRNSKAVAALKALYGGHCQLTGGQFVFRKVNGELYCEAHHLIPLGEGGGDSPYNLIIVSPLIHRMLHYAEVSGLDLDKIANNKLQIKINDEPFTITWHPKHAELVTRAKAIRQER